ncbi:glycoside hydrolase family 32 protein [Sinomonas sp. ASV322]|uniref:glycoside hydrolase family 32 protein n=1 Tax=Sinomonas sp. ASV322 TaxID=3041920 RepID=UPI0027DB17AC|nr:glycoside hydrolase family 32 protein [Sinomonas sp. ASV322]MDQ4502873.1 glycoside hydrolase family 32 protein [Sinomonas sp. ASV322]
MRPAFHFAAERGWINDPHGITVKDGAYHLFYQYVPESMEWAPNCHWGHARGADLFSLRGLPVALAPGEGDDGVWTGSLVTDGDGGTRLFYTSTAQPDIGIGRIRVATPKDSEWIEWSKGDFVADVPAGLDIIAYRDPFLVKEPDGWRMFVGAGSSDGTAMALSYTSADLAAWDYEGVALKRSTEERDPVWLGALWECPQIFEIDGRHVMVSSVWDDDVLHYAGYAIGDYAEGRFEPTTWGRLTYGPSYYAPSFFRDADGRPCLTFWMRGIADPEAGWASAHSVPHVLTLDGDRLVASPHPDLVKYRGAPAGQGELPGLSGDIAWWPAPGDALRVTCEGETVFVLKAGSAAIGAMTASESLELPFGGGEVRVVVDAQAIEVSTRDGVLGFGVRPGGATYAVEASHAVAYPLSHPS